MKGIGKLGILNGNIGAGKGTAKGRTQYIQKLPLLVDGALLLIDGDAVRYTQMTTKDPCFLIDGSFVLIDGKVCKLI
jgi:hypothetical protein